MDCGPAALKALLEGFRIPASYNHLRNVCRTDVDGTSIDTIESLACELGLDAEQVMIPRDHVLLREAAALPAVAVVNSPRGGTHFIVAWRQIGPALQIMDPTKGRLWVSKRSFLDSLYEHTTIVPAGAWREWAGTPAFLGPVRRRLTALGLPKSTTERHVATAVADPTWRALAALDAAARLVATLRTDGCMTSRGTADVLAALLADPPTGERQSLIPAHFWSARPATPEGGDERLALRGVVLVRASRRSDSVREPTGPDSVMATAVKEASRQPFAEMLALVRTGLLGRGVVAAAMAVAVFGVVLEALLLRSLLDVGLYLRTVEQSLSAALILGSFGLLMLGLEFGLGSTELRLGRQFESKLRIAFLKKIPRLADAYFQSRPVSDLAERGHSAHVLRRFPALIIRMLRIAMELVVTVVAIAWLAPGAALPAAIAAGLAAGIPLAGLAVLGERDLRVRTHAGALGRFHLDALLGRRAIEANGAGATVIGEHEQLLAEWIRSSISLQHGTLGAEALQTIVGFGLVGWIVVSHVAADHAAATLLVAYWVLNLPVLGYELSLHAREYPSFRSTLVRLLEPLEMAANDDTLPRPAPVPEPLAEPVRIEAKGVVVRIAGHQVLEAINLAIEPGTHVAIVGPSGAGKSTLINLALGCHQASEGVFLVDGTPLDQERTEGLRAETAWVDPTVRLWNSSLLDNLRYGTDPAMPLANVLEAAGLLPVIAKLPEGLATPLGEGGALLSAGEAQRVRLARAMLKPAPRLVVLDEPFMGLERDRRRALLSDVRQRWASATLLYVTHEIGEARSFDRVLVIDRGRVVEDGDPRLLTATPSSRYRRLLQAQETAYTRLHTSSEWRRVRLDDGRIVQDISNASVEQSA
jgi:ATP-binding cassette subfamily B protein